MRGSSLSRRLSAPKRNRYSLTRRKGSQAPATAPEVPPSPTDRPLRRTFLGKSVKSLPAQPSNEVSSERNSNWGAQVAHAAGSLVPQPMRDTANFSMNMLKRNDNAKAWWLIHPDKPAKLTWDVIGLLLLMYTVTLGPRRILLNRPGGPSRCGYRPSCLQPSP